MHYAPTSKVAAKPIISRHHHHHHHHHHHGLRVGGGGGLGWVNSYAPASTAGKRGTRKQSTSTKKKKKKTVKKAPKKPKKKVLSPKQKEKQKADAQKLEIKELKSAIIEPPKKLPATVYSVAIQERLPALKDDYAKTSQAFKAVAEEVKALSSYEQQVGLFLSPFAVSPESEVS